MDKLSRGGVIKHQMILFDEEILVIFHPDFFNLLFFLFFLQLTVFFIFQSTFSKTKTRNYLIHQKHIFNFCHNFSKFTSLEYERKCPFRDIVIGGKYTDRLSVCPFVRLTWGPSIVHVQLNHGQLTSIEIGLHLSCYRDSQD